jgi:hypothetical protein
VYYCVLLNASHLGIFNVTFTSAVKALFISLFFIVMSTELSEANTPSLRYIPATAPCDESVKTVVGAALRHSDEIQKSPLKNSWLAESRFYRNNQGLLSYIDVGGIEKFKVTARAHGEGITLAFSAKNGLIVAVATLGPDILREGGFAASATTK